MVFDISKRFFPEAGNLRKRDNDGIHQTDRKITLREIKHLMFNKVPVIRLEWQPHAPIDVIPEYLVAPDCIERVRGDVLVSAQSTRRFASASSKASSFWAPVIHR